MGTRGLTAVIKNEKPVVAQYGQWDHYPGGQGDTIVKFLRKASMKKFSRQVDKCRWITDKEAEEINKEFGEWMDMDTAARYKKKYPLLSRDVGGEILSSVYKSKDPEIILSNSWDFIKDSLFCEWAYIIDLDKGMFQVCKGFQNQPTEGNPYGETAESGSSKEYYPCKPVAEWPIAEIPDDWIQIADPPEKEEEENN